MNFEKTVTYLIICCMVFAYALVKELHNAVSNKNSKGLSYSHTPKTITTINNNNNKNNTSSTNSNCKSSDNNNNCNNNKNNNNNANRKITNDNNRNSTSRANNNCKNSDNNNNNDNRKSTNSTNNNCKNNDSNNNNCENNNNENDDEDNRNSTNCSCDNSNSNLISSSFDSCYNFVNSKRLLHYGTKPLVCSEKLENDAEKWAKHLMDTGKVRHERSIHHGETIYCVQVKGAAATKKNVLGQTCCAAIMKWYNGVLQYDYKHPGKYDQTLAFTQIVWKATKEIGIGAARKGKSVCVVARYKPRGNVPGVQSFEENVQPLK